MTSALNRAAAPAIRALGATFEIDADRRRRGPYTAAGDLVAAFIDQFGVRAQQAAAPRLVTLLAIRPELAARLAVPDLVAQSLDFTREGNRRSWSLRSAHSIVEFLIESLGDAGPVYVTFHGVAHADPLDIEFVEVLQRRADPAQWVLASFPEGGSREDLVSEGSDDRERRAWHLRRAEQLEALDEPSLRLGAIPLHREQAGEDAAPLATAARRCMHFAFYEAALDWGERACRLAAALGDEASFNAALRDRIFSLLLLDRFAEAEALCDRALAEMADPEIRVHAGYAKAILAVRLRLPRDVPAARRHIEAALAAAAELDDPEARTAKRAFLGNTLALIVTREGDPAAALALMDEAIGSLERGAPARFAREGMILFQNRARLHVHAGREAAALADLGRLLELEPGNAEALFDRAMIHHRAGRTDEALRDYGAALFWAPPQVETLLNRAELLGQAGDDAAALADYDHLLAIEPDHAEGLHARARLRWRRGEFATASSDIDRALTAEPGNARMLCLDGLIALGEGALDRAERAFDLAVDHAPELAEAWANRAILHWRRGRLDVALSDLDRAAALGDDPAILRNRSKVAAALIGAREDA